MTKGSFQSCGPCEPTPGMMAHFCAGASRENAGLSEHRVWAQHLRPNALDDRLAAGVDAEVLERRLEVRRVWLQRAQPQHLRPHVVHLQSVTQVGVRSDAVLMSGMCCFSKCSISTCVPLQTHVFEVTMAACAASCRLSPFCPFFLQPTCRTGPSKAQNACLSALLARHHPPCIPAASTMRTHAHAYGAG